MTKEETHDEIEEVMYALYTKVFKDGQNHSDPSPKTLELINNTNVEVRDMKNKIEHIEEKVDDILEFIKTMDKRYASKLTQTIVYTSCGAFLLAIGGIILNTIFK